MAKKRKSDATRLDEVDRTMYSTFCSAANSLSQLYSQAMHHQRLSFQAGERHALEKLYNWTLRQQEGGARVATWDVLAYIQNELDYGTQELPQTAVQSTHSGTPVPSNSFGAATIGQGLRSGNPDNQTRNSVFSNALSSPVRRTLQHYHLTHGSSYSNNIISSANGQRNNENSCLPGRDPNPPSSIDTSMDTHADSPGYDSPY
ncbi:uncharacterized protein LOC111408667 isoform X2 [Olea europaea var. sylvestris]|uniref:uncharacterized protein LOC111408667 isoform X1 n=1 Tax=Olea europaea var. sylvestris TaxID=158386 RepID=UPI000C1CD983|nr:uncharacterized protein LOC111408667 isoform X1 [Olea europaea var. sylvestris]XP_022894169.1 uncharacterized protein LOC111408667 isoform X2 [Olea europaea var. sylvestris]